MRTNTVIDDQLMADALKATGLSYSLCDKFNLYSSDRSLCPLCLEWFVPLTIYCRQSSLTI